MAKANSTRDTKIRQLAAEGKKIPDPTAILGHPRPPTPAEIEYGKKLAEEMGK